MLVPTFRNQLSKITINGVRSKYLGLQSTYLSNHLVSFVAILKSLYRNLKPIIARLTKGK